MAPVLVLWRTDSVIQILNQDLLLPKLLPLDISGTYGTMVHKGTEIPMAPVLVQRLDSVCMHDMLTIVVKKIETFKNVSTQCMVFKKCLRQHNLEPASFQWLKKYSRTSEKQ